MGTFGDKFGEAFRNYNTDGVPASGDYEPEKAVIRSIGPALDDAFNAAISGIATYATVADLPISPAPAPGTQARVYDDPTATNNVVWKYLDGAWAIDDEFYSGLASVVQPLVDEANDATADAQGYAAAAQANLDAIIALNIPTVAATELLAKETDGWGIDFTKAVDTDRMINKVANVVTRSSALAAVSLGLSNGLPTRITNSNGTRSWTPHNLYTGNSNSPGAISNKACPVVVGYQVTVLYSGTGTVTLSGAGSQSMSPNTPYTFTATTTNLAVTTVAGVTNLQICYGSAVTAYVATINVSKTTAPISWDAQLGCYVLLCEPATTNFFLNSGSPATQAISLAAGTYGVWLDGVGGDSITVSGGPTGVATPGAPVSFTLGSTTSVTFTVAGSPTHVQVQNRATPTSQIITFAVSQQRFACNPNVLFTAMTAAIQAANTAGNPMTLYVDYAYTNATGAQESISSIGTSAGTDYLDIRINAGNPQVYRKRSADTQVNWSLLTKITMAADGKSNATTFPALSATARHQITLNVQSNQLYGSSDGTQIGSSGTQLSMPPTPGTALWFGSLLGSNFLQGPMRIARIAIVAGATGPDRICSRFTQITPLSTETFNTVPVIGQSNAAGNASGGTQDTGGNTVLQTLQVGGALVQAKEPLDNPIPVIGASPYYVGVALPLALKIIASGPAPVTRWVILPEGIGNTGFGGTNTWGVGNAYHNNAVSAFDSLRLRYPNARLSFILVSRGEYDATVIGMNQATYAAYTDAEINAWRTAYGATIPVVIDTPQPGYVASNSAAFAPILAAIFDTPNRLSRIAIADESALAANPSDPPHFTVAQNKGPRRDNIYNALLVA